MQFKIPIYITIEEDNEKEAIHLVADILESTFKTENKITAIGFQDDPTYEES